MPTSPPRGELDFLKKAENFAELRTRLNSLGLTSDLALLNEYASHIAECWFKLGEQHLTDARAALSAVLVRTVFSRTYYAVYNVSKAVRYMNSGSVSLKGDDHKAAPDLPADFVDVAMWSRIITTLYEHRLRADYDNWLGTASSHTLSPSDAVVYSGDFIREARKHLKVKHGVNV